jgi:DnaK suppressor protein
MIYNATEMEALVDKEISLDQTRARLKAERASLLGDASPQEGVASDISESNNLFALEEWRQDYLREIEHALEKLADGTYGRCDSCGGPIDPDRLSALSHSCLCLACKSKGGLAKSRTTKTTVRALSYNKDD